MAVMAKFKKRGVPEGMRGLLASKIRSGDAKTGLDRSAAFGG